MRESTKLRYHFSNFQLKPAALWRYLYFPHFHFSIYFPLFSAPGPSSFPIQFSSHPPSPVHYSFVSTRHMSLLTFFSIYPLASRQREEREREGNTNERESEWRRDDGVRAAKTGSLFVRSPCCVHPWKRSLFTQKSSLLYSILSYSCLQTPPNHHRHFPSLLFPLASFRPHLSVE